MTAQQPPSDGIPSHKARRNAKVGYDATQPPRGRRPRNPEAPPSREARVQYIMREVAAGRWEGGDSIRDLALTWGVSESNLCDIAAEAKRRVAAVDDGNIVRLTLGLAADEGVKKALEFLRKNDVRALQGLAALIRAWGDLSEVTSKGAPEGVPVFRVELAAAPPTTDAACPAPFTDPPPPGPSSPRAGDPDRR